MRAREVAAGMGASRLPPSSRSYSLNLFESVVCVEHFFLIDDIVIVYGYV